MNTTEAVFVPADPDSPVTPIEVPSSVDDIAAALGAVTVQQVGLSDSVSVWVDEYSALTGKPRNPRAETITNAFIIGFTTQDSLRGDAVLVGHSEDQEMAPLPDDALSLFMKLTDSHGDLSRRGMPG